MSIANARFLKQGLFIYRGRDLSVLVISIAAIIFSIALYRLLAAPTQFPKWVIDIFPFVDWVNDAQRWMEQNIKHFTRAISNAIRVPLEALEETLWELPWFFIFSAFVLLGLAYGVASYSGAWLTCGLKPCRL